MALNHILLSILTNIIILVIMLDTKSKENNKRFEIVRTLSVNLLITHSKPPKRKHLQNVGHTLNPRKHTSLAAAITS